MRVYFHADITHGQAAAVWRCRDLLQSRFGIYLVNDVPTALPGDMPSLLLVHTKNDDWPSWLEFDLPVVALERIDGARAGESVESESARGHQMLKLSELGNA
jgi:hypothetical protein